MGNIGKLFAEAIGTFWLVLGGCGSAVLAAASNSGSPLATRYSTPAPAMPPSTWATT